MKNLFTLFWMLPLLVVLSCNSSAEEDLGTVKGLKPIYAADINPENISIEAARPVENLGKIYVQDDLLFIGERNEGIHVFDNSDPANPVNLHFISIYGNREMAIKGNILYVDNFSDLVAIDISDFDHLNVVRRVNDVYEIGNGQYPTEYSGVFECVDTKKGVVVGWEQADLIAPKCRR